MTSELQDVGGRVAIMQPYFFPYLGYYQLSAAVETFVFYDDVQFIMRGYIARNKLDLGGKEYLFTVPLSGASQNKKISEVGIDMPGYVKWRSRFLKTVDLNYAKARNYTEGRALLEEVLELQDDRISTLAARSVILPMERMGRNTRYLFSSQLDLRTELKREERLMHICRVLGSEDYIQSQGGTELYSSERWQRQRLSLRFLRPLDMAYPRPGGAVPGLSMLDAILHVPFGELSRWLDRYELFTN